MQKLFENWRYYLNESKYEYCKKHGIPMRACREIPATHLPPPESWARTQQTIGANIGEMVSIQRQMLSLIFPPLAIPEAVDAIKTLRENPSFGNAGLAALALLATIPFVGGPAKAGQVGGAVSKAHKAKTVKGIINSAEETSKSMKGAPQYEELAQQIDKAVIHAKNELNWPLRALDEAFEKGIIDLQAFQVWIKKMKPDIKREEVMEMLNEIKRIVDGIDDTDAVELYIKSDHQFFNVMKKFNVKVDPSMGNGGWTDSLASAAPEIWDKYIKKYGLKPGEKIPTSTVGLAIRQGSIDAVQTRRAKAKQLKQTDPQSLPGYQTREPRARARQIDKNPNREFAHTLFHEIGHTQILTHLPSLGRPFLKEYRALIRQRMKDIQGKWNLDAWDHDAAEKLEFFWQRYGSDLWDGTPDGLANWKAILIDEGLADAVRLDKQKMLAALQYRVLQATEKSIRTAEASGDINKFMASANKSKNYAAFRDVAPISQGLGMHQERFYLLNFEEVAAELFEKAVRKRAQYRHLPLQDRPPLQSKQFPETIKIFQKIVDDEITNLINESKKQKFKIRIIIESAKK